MRILYDQMQSRYLVFLFTPAQNKTTLLIHLCAGFKIAAGCHWHFHKR